MEEAISLMIYLEQTTEDCCDRFNRHEVGEDIYGHRANGDDAGHIEDTEEEIEDDRAEA